MQMAWNWHSCGRENLPAPLIRKDLGTSLGILAASLSPDIHRDLQEAKWFVFQPEVNVVKVVNTPRGSCWRVLCVGGGDIDYFDTFTGAWALVRVQGYKAIAGSEGVGLIVDFRSGQTEAEGDRRWAHGHAACLRLPNQIGRRPGRDLLWGLGISSGPATGHA